MNTKQLSAQELQSRFEAYCRLWPEADMSASIRDAEDGAAQGDYEINSADYFTVALLSASHRKHGLDDAQADANEAEAEDAATEALIGKE